MAIEPGDLIVGDDDGLLGVSFDDVDEVLKGATAKYQAEQKQIENIKAGSRCVLGGQGASRLELLACRLIAGVGGRGSGL
ncbi:hypothetical protein AB4Z51_39820 [Bradyrhizobium sp. 2TAF36]|uniref:hypothetical protein n=1 Tax=unclassified Bradyrhizobium TaxID=2631580 RepID=UPI001FCE5453|nr:hypothetical protein [Bradyrhizobium sp. MOS001]